MDELLQMMDYDLLQMIRYHLLLLYILCLISGCKSMGDAYEKRAAKLKEDVKIILEKVADEDPLDALEMVDDLQRLGVFYHFKDEIERVLERIYNMNDKCNNEDLHATALKFRLLRQHGYNVPQDVFKKFTDETGNLRSCLCEDTKGLLYLYEASYLSIDGESLLDEARDFTTRNLKENLKKKDIDQNLAMLVRHSLELPLHWRVQRLEARWFIDVYERRQDMNPVLFELAKLDFNMVQAIHQQEVKQISSSEMWWRSTCLGKKLSFARDRLMENFLGTLGVNFEPQFGYFRRMSTKVYTLMTIIDDIYDVYGSLEELELFTNAVERWDISAMEQLLDYMKICFLALFNSINEMAYDALKEQGLHIISHLKKIIFKFLRLIDHSKCFSGQIFAKWYYNGYTPTFEEYMKNAWISISGPVILVHAYCFDSKSEASECLLESYPNIIRWSSIIFRLSDDLGTSSDELQRGDVPKSIQCYMHETGAPENDAREHMKYLIGETWKKMNEDGAANSLFTKTFIGNAMNLARMGADPLDNNSLSNPFSPSPSSPTDQQWQRVIHKLPSMTRSIHNLNIKSSRFEHQQLLILSPPHHRLQPLSPNRHPNLVRMHPNPPAFTNRAPQRLTVEARNQPPLAVPGLDLAYFA
ncbi:hypothetical protein HYC85_011287 [Camellia sinensis]|uniref:Uncharacterized protein n=1 Tax=Camellia sinensis TaxID=4442 RepID=A0A7J7HBP0_CAMSI|nr:hypothetical protein HYC85_011287 [Camellia sinensis]